ncbi:MAG TPA: hypothetical protein VFA48_05295, partial [Gammaproteobacteria bacterium]|nr:hypothetical protein [Gammaproteobacteria bacterium]
MQKTITQIERRRLVYFVFLALLGLAVAAGMTAAALPILMMWMVLAVFGTGFSTLGSVLRRRKRNRIANILRQWESEHPLRPMADAAYGDSLPPEAPFAIRWLAINRDESPFDWTHNSVEVSPRLCPGHSTHLTPSQRCGTLAACGSAARCSTQRCCSASRKPPRHSPSCRGA